MSENFFTGFFTGAEIFSAGSGEQESKFLSDRKSWIILLKVLNFAPKSCSRTLQDFQKTAINPIVAREYDTLSGLW